MMERSQEIPCSECESMREDEIDPFPHLKFVSCNPIPGKDGWCLIKWLEN